MVSTLEVDPGTALNDSLQPAAGPRRGQRDQVSQPQTYSLSDTKSVLAIPFVFLMLAMHAMYYLVKQLITAPARTVREFFVVNQEVDEILRDMPEEQAEQKRLLELAHEGQIEQRCRLEDLQRRIEAIEQRRAAREDTVDSPDLKIAQG